MLRLGHLSLRSLSYAFALLLSMSIGASTYSPSTRVQPLRDVAQIYAQYCANCHGGKFEGGKGPALNSGTMKHGVDDGSIARSIRGGFPPTGMPAFGKLLDDAHLRALVVLIREASASSGGAAAGGRLPIPSEIQHSELHTFRVESVVENLDVPWAIAFLPGGRLLVTERNGSLLIRERDADRIARIEGVPIVVTGDEAGLFDVAVDPDYERTGWIYLSFSDAGPNDTTMTKIVRGRLNDGSFVDSQTVFAAVPEAYGTTRAGFGGRLLLDENYLYFSVGDLHLRERAQDLSYPNGKVHRVLHDGTIPPGNPFVRVRGALGSIWTLGHRNPQGLARDPATGQLWESEHGPRGGDELNILRRGRNYGWPLLTYGIGYDGTPIARWTTRKGMEPPVIQWTPSIAVSAMMFYSGDRFPLWRHNLFVGSLAQQKLLRIELDKDAVMHQELIADRWGRIRAIVTGPDGLIYLALETPGRIVRLAPA